VLSVILQQHHRDHRVSKLDQIEKRIITSTPAWTIEYDVAQVNYALDWPYPNHFFSYFKRQQRQLLVLLQGCVEREKIQLPVFQRWSWAEEMNASVLILNDPTLMNNQLSIGWWQGSEQNYALPQACEFIKLVIHKLGLSAEDVVFFGSSAGGFVALMMAALIKGSMAIVNNPQTNILRYRVVFYTALLKEIFADMPKEEALAKYPTRFCALELFKSINYIPKIAYYQNTRDYFHFQNHFQPFIDEIYKSSIDPNEFQSVLYKHHSGHSPLDKPKVITILNHWLTQLKSSHKPMPLNEKVDEFISIYKPIPITNSQQI